MLGYRAVAALTDSEAQLTAEAARWRDARRAVRAARGRPAAGAAARGRASARRRARLARATSTATAMRRCGFSRAGPEFATEPGSAGQRIGYRLRGGAVEVLYWPHLDQPAARRPGRAMRWRPASRASASAYLDTGGAWRERWPALGEPALPRAVRVELDARRRRAGRALAGAATDAADPTPARAARGRDHPGDAAGGARGGRRRHRVRRPAALGRTVAAPPRPGAGAGAGDGGRSSGRGRSCTTTARGSVDRPPGRALGGAAAVDPARERQHPRRDRGRAGAAQHQRAGHHGRDAPPLERARLQRLFAQRGGPVAASTRSPTGSTPTRSRDRPAPRMRTTWRRRRLGSPPTHRYCAAPSCSRCAVSPTGHRRPSRPI